MSKTLSDQERKTLGKNSGCTWHRKWIHVFDRAERDKGGTKVAYGCRTSGNTTTSRGEGKAFGQYNEQLKARVYFRRYVPRKFGCDCAIFARHMDLYAWAEWEILWVVCLESDLRASFGKLFLLFGKLFAFPTPSLVPQDYKAGQKLQLSSNIGDLKADRGRDPRFVPGMTRAERFWQHVMDVLMLRDLKKPLSIKDVPWTYFRLTRIFHGFTSWTSYAIQIAFPFLTLISICFVFAGAYCMFRLQGECEFESYKSSSEL